MLTILDSSICCRRVLDTPNLLPGDIQEASWSLRKYLSMAHQEPTPAAAASSEQGRQHTRGAPQVPVDESVSSSGAKGGLKTGAENRPEAVAAPGTEESGGMERGPRARKGAHERASARGGLSESETVDEYDKVHSTGQTANEYQCEFEDEYEFEYEDEGVWEKVREGLEAQETARRALKRWGEAAELRVLPCVDGVSGRHTRGVPSTAPDAGARGAPGTAGHAGVGDAGGIPELGLGSMEWLRYLGAEGGQSEAAFDSAVRNLVAEVSSSRMKYCTVLMHAHSCRNKFGTVLYRLFVYCYACAVSSCQA